MVPSDTSSKTIAPMPVHTSYDDDQYAAGTHISKLSWWRLSAFHMMTWICLILACIGTSWFACQYFLVPQPTQFAPQWAGAQWVQARDATTPVAYFRSVLDVDAVPDGAFVTVAANQTFRLYVNGTLIGSNSLDFVQGNYPLAYMYDIVALLQPGPNVIALRVENQDQQPPALRVNLGLVRGHTVYYRGTSQLWQATAQSTLVYPRYATKTNTWATSDFDASSWQPAKQIASLSLSPMLTVDPLLYQQPIPAHWVSAGVGHEAYFVRQINVSAGTSATWLRLVASGVANIFINGHLIVVWNGEPSVPLQNVNDYFSYDDTVIQYRSGLVLGVYNIAPYVHPGVNTIAVHVLAPGESAARVGLDTLKTALSLDVLMSNVHGQDVWFPSDQGWHAATQPVDGWTQGNTAAMAWAAPVVIARPGASRTFYLPDNNTPRSKLLVPLSQVAAVVLGSSIAIVGVWLLLALFVVRRYARSWRGALERTSLIYVPALAVEGLLIVLSLEPRITQPFPYTWFWGLILILIVVGSCLLLWIYERMKGNGSVVGASFSTPVVPVVNSSNIAHANNGRAEAGPYDAAIAFLRTHWALVLLMVLAIPLICYQPAYEPYWQDELTSYYAAKGVLAHGLPLLPSGFLYLKGELYSYLLALTMAIFGDQNGVPRMLSIVEYLVSLPLLYGIGSYFFNKRIAVLATAMLALAPDALLWGRQVRMYEQAQLLTLLAVYLFYKALREPQRVRPVYLAVGCLVAAYLSHEEIFIILPALVVCVLIASRDTTHRLPTVMYQKHWWYAAGMGASTIALQLLLVRITHPPILGTDQSQQPLVQLTVENIPYYIRLLFSPVVQGNATLFTVNSLLATAGCVLAFYQRDKRALYCGLFFLISLLTLVLVFTLSSERYLYPLLPIYYLMGAYALVVGLTTVWGFARERLSSQPVQPTTSMPLSVREGAVPQPIRFVAMAVLGIVGVCVLLLPMLPISDYNLFVSRATALSYHRHYPDYDQVGNYLHAHWQRGDVVVAVSPAISVLYYVGHVDAFFSLDRALYLFEQDGKITDTPTGSTPLLSQDDFQALVATHARVWIVSDNDIYQSGVIKERRFVFPPDFHIVFEGYQSALYFRGS